MLRFTCDVLKKDRFYGATISSCEVLQTMWIPSSLMIDYVSSEIMYVSHVMDSENDPDCSVSIMDGFLRDG